MPGFKRDPAEVYCDTKKIANVELGFSFIMAGKELAGAVLRAGNPLFFFTLSLVEEKSEPFVKIKLCFVTNALIVLQKQICWIRERSNFFVPKMSHQN